MNLPRMAISTVAQRLWSFDGRETEELRYAATASDQRQLVLLVVLPH